MLGKHLLVVLAISMTACAAAPLDEHAEESAGENIGTTQAALSVGDIIVYRANEAVPQCELSPLGPPDSLGGTVLSGNPKLSARIDYADGAFLGGIFQATRGKVLIHFPFTEHATILSGHVKLTDEAGNRHVFNPGDSYLITQGSNIIWEVDGPLVQKAFFNRTESAEHPGPMQVYDKGDAVAQSSLVDLGPPEGLGGTVVSGNPAISARVDFARDGLLGGVFQATKGVVLIHFPFTEHATITKGDVKLQDAHGKYVTLRPGDGYLIKQNSVIGWDVSKPLVQKSFLNFTAP